MGGILEAERLGCRQIDDQIELGRLFDREVGRLRSAQNLVNIVGGAPEKVREACSIGHETARFDILAEACIVGSRAASAKVLIRIRLAFTSVSAHDIKRLRAALERREGWRDVLGAPNFEHVRHRGRACARLPATSRISSAASELPTLANDRNRLQAGDNFAQEFEPLAGSVGCLPREPCDVAARARQTRDQAGADRVAATAKTIGMTDVVCFAARLPSFPT